jgi:hypothetical protein
MSLLALRGKQGIYNKLCLADCSSAQPSLTAKQYIFLKIPRANEKRVESNVI